MPDLDKMSETELAAYYQRHRDELASWEEVESPVPPGSRPRIAGRITVEFPPDEMDALRQLAARSDASYTEVIRRAVRALARSGE